MKNKFSLITILVLFIFICVKRYNVLTENELAWDIFGYYLYLPATIIHHDPMLTDISWIHEAMQQREISGTLYQLTRSPQNTDMYFFLMGMSVLYAPLFFVGHIIAMAGGYPADGFSIPYQYSIALGTLLYTFIGLLLMRKVLLKYFSDTVTSIAFIVIVAGTNYFHFVTSKNLETPNYLFVLLSLLIWFTVKWHENFKLKYLIGISSVISITSLVKPSEIMCAFIPLLWGVYNKETLKQKWQLIKNHKTQIIIALGVALIIVLPQMLYWKTATGFFIFDSYKNAGVGLDIFSPHIINILFSFKKGWLIYTPIMLFALAGFVFLHKTRKNIFFSLFVYFLISFYIIASWTEWWYGAGYSIRPLVTTYAVLAFPLACSIEKIFSLNLLRRLSFAFIAMLMIALNWFQLWQFNNYILDPYRTTTAYYFAIFGKTTVTEEDKKLLSIERSFTGKNVLKDESGYTKKILGGYNFNTIDTNLAAYYVMDTITNSMVFKLDSTMAFSPNVKTTYDELTKKDHAWARASVDVFIPAGYNEELPCLVLTMARREGAYGYLAVSIEKEKLKFNEWITISTDYLTPEARDVDDTFQSYIWHRGKQPVYIDNYSITIFDPK